MSYILDALKKNEHEKAKKKGAAGVASISGQMLGPEKFKQRKGRSWIIGVSVVLVAILASAVTWYLLKDDKKARSVKAAPAQVVAPDERGVAATPSTAPAGVPPQAPTATASPAVADAPAPPAATAPEEVENSAAARRRRFAEEREGSRMNKAPAAPAPAAPAPAVSATPARPVAAPPQPAEQHVAPPADIKVSGIAWQEERRARRAVVNGFLLKEGAVVGGAKITEILPEKVRFSMSGRTFEISMHSSAVTGAGK